LRAILPAVLEQLGVDAAQVSASSSAGDASSQKNENINTKTTHASSQKNENINTKTTHASSQKNENINTKTTRTNLGPTVTQLPPAQPAREPAAPKAQGQVGRARRGRGPTPLSAILPAVLKQLGGDAAQVLESTESGETP
jgi:hypothetical protein